MKAVEDHPITDGKSFSLADEGDAGGRRKLVAAAGVVQHRETIIIAFDEDADNGGYPPHERDEGEDQNTNDIYRLPEAVAEGETDAAKHVMAKGSVKPHFIFLAMEQGVGLFAQIGEERRADDQHQIFKEREPEEDQDEMDHEAAHYEKIIQNGTSLVLQEAVDAKPAKP